MLPTRDQLRYYWLVMQDDVTLPCAMFTLECDAMDWIEQQEAKEIYYIVKPLAY